MRAPGPGVVGSHLSRVHLGYIRVHHPPPASNHRIAAWTAHSLLTHIHRRTRATTVHRKQIIRLQQLLNMGRARNIKGRPKDHKKVWKNNHISRTAGALTYLGKCKDRGVFKQVTRILFAYKTQHQNMDDLVDAAIETLRGHNDLLFEFALWLPDPQQAQITYAICQSLYGN